MEYNEKIIQQFGGWAPYFRNFIESEEMGRIFGYLKQRTSEGVKIYPLSKDVFRCFRETPPDSLRIILSGFCPYHTADKNGVPFADGLMMSNSYSKYQKSPSLSILYSGIETDIAKGLDLGMELPNSLEYLAHQGVLLYNSSLTVEAGKAGSHQDLWSKFNQYFFEEVINKFFRGLPIIFFGKESAKSERLLQNMLHYPMVVDHPASSAYKNGIWDCKNIFSRCNEILKQNNGEEIQWIQYNQEEAPF